MIYFKRFLDLIGIIIENTAIAVSVLVCVTIGFVLGVIWTFLFVPVAALAILELVLVTPVYYIATGEWYYDNFHSIIAVWESISDMPDVLSFRKSKTRTKNTYTHT